MMHSSFSLYIVHTYVAFKSTICGWIGTVRDCYILHEKYLKDIMKRFDANDIVVVEEGSSKKKIPISVQM